MQAGQVIFTVDRMAYVWEDVVLAGHVWGDWTALEQRVRDGLACLARLDDDDDDALDEAEVEAAACDFRYARDLVAAADLEAWLERRGVTVDAWLDFIRRSVLLRRRENDLDEIRAAYELDEDEVAEAVLCEAICGGMAVSLAERLAARAAVYARMRDEGGEATVLTAEPPEDVAQARRERVHMLSRLEAAWQEFIARNAPPEALRGMITARQLDWMRFTVQTVLAPDVEVAREITLCVREDGRPIDQVAAEAGLRAEMLEWWLEDVEPSVREALVGAMPGDVLGPLALKEGHLVLAVGNKRLPAEDDTTVRGRAERALLARTVDHEVAKRVKWHGTL